MGFRSWLKSAFSSARYLSSTVRPIEGMGMNGAKYRPFDPERAVRALNHWVYAAAMLRANAGSNVGLRLYARKRGNVVKHYETRPVDGYMKHFFAGKTTLKPVGQLLQKVVAFGADIEEVIERHPALSILQSVNPWQNGYELNELRSIDQQLTGNSYLHVVLDKSLGIPAEVWRMPPQWTEVIPSQSNFIWGYSYGQTMAQKDKYPAEEVIHFKYPNPRDTHYGMGWTEAAWKSIGLHEAKREMDTARADNYARPDWAMIVKSGASEEEVKRAKADLKAKFGGPRNTGEPIVVTGDVGFQELNFDEKEYGTPTRLIEEIAAISQTPVAMLLSNDPNRANSEAARLAWYRNVILGDCTRDAEKLNEKWIPMFGEAADDMFLCYDHTCFEDEAALSKKVIGLVAGGILSPNEGRSELGYTPIDGGDAIYPPAGGAGVSAGAGNLAPGQNDDRTEGSGPENPKAMLAA